jgi:hypothetical protein
LSIRTVYRNGWPSSAERDGWTAHTERIEMLGNLMFGDLWNEGSTSRENPIAESV